VVKLRLYEEGWSIAELILCFEGLGRIGGVYDVAKDRRSFLCKEFSLAYPSENSSQYHSTTALAAYVQYDVSALALRGQLARGSDGPGTKFFKQTAKWSQ